MPLIDIVLIQSCLRARAVVPIRLIYIALFRTDPKRGRFVIREVERCDGDLAGLIMTCMIELEGFLCTYNIQSLKNLRRSKKLT